MYGFYIFVAFIFEMNDSIWLLHWDHHNHMNVHIIGKVSK